MIEIKKSDGTTIISLPDMPSGSKYKCELMVDDYVTICFTADEPLFFPLGAYLDIPEGKFVATRPQTPVYNTNTGGYDYELVLDKYYMAWKNRIHKFSPSYGGMEASWSLTADITTHANKILDNVRSCGFKHDGNDFILSVDSSVQSGARLVSYNNSSIIDAMTSIAETFECEWWVVGNVIHFGRCESGTQVNLELGINVEKMSTSESKAEYATRIIPFGSTRNIPHNYRSVTGETTITGIVEKRLMLPESVNDGKNYIDSGDGDIVEKVVVFDYIYPKYVCTIQDIETYTSTTKDEEDNDISQTFYKLKVDDGFVFSKDYILKGEELKMTFESGSLRGMVFGAQFHSDTNQFEVVVNSDYGRELPDSNLYPRVGDTLAFSGFDISLVGDLYVPQAEQELYQESLKYIEKSNIDPNTYTCTMMADSENTCQYQLGQKVKLISQANFEQGYRESRVIGFERCLDIPYDHPVYTIGESAAYSRIGELTDKLDSANQNITSLEKRKVNVDLSEYKKWSETLAKLGMTTIVGGYIMSNMLALADSSGNIMAGMNGLYNESAEGGGAAAWYGGDMDSAKTLFRFDGSGFVANGNISWNSNGQVTLSETAKILGTNVTMKNVADMTDLWEKVNIGTSSNPIWAVKSKYHVVSEGELVGYYNGEGLNIGGGGGDGASSIKYGSQVFNSVDGVIDISDIAISGGVSSWNDLTDKPSWIGSSKPSYNFSEIGSKPTTISGYGITDAITSANIGSQSVDSSMRIYGSWIKDLNTPTWNEDNVNVTINSYSRDAQNRPSTFSNANVVINLGLTKHGTNGMYGQQIAIDNQGLIYTRNWTAGYIYSWKTIAFTSSNVASATKLQTARSLWNNSFDGSNDLSKSLFIQDGEGTEVCARTKRTDTGRDMFFGIGSGGDNAGIYDVNAQYWIIKSAIDKDVHINNSKLVVKSNGNIGVGNTNPNFNFDVYGSVQANQIVFANPTTYSANPTDHFRIGRFDENGGLKMQFGSTTGKLQLINKAWNTALFSVDTSGNLVVSGESTAYSDARLKQSVNDLVFRGALMPKSFIKDGKQSIGFIAQEVRELYPELVLGEETEDSYLSLNYGAITAVLACQTNEHEKRIAELERENKELKRKLNIN